MTSDASATPGRDARAEELARVRSYLLAQSEKYDLVDLWPRIIGQRLAFIEALDGLTDAQARWRPPADPALAPDAEEAWGVLEVAQHVAGWTENVLAIVRALEAGDGAVEKAPPGQLVFDPERPLAVVRRDLIAASMRLAAAMVDAGRADPSVTVDHALFGPLNARAWLLFQRLHDTDHINQVNALRSDSGFPPAS